MGRLKRHSDKYAEKLKKKKTSLGAGGTGLNAGNSAKSGISGSRILKVSG